MYQQSEWLTQMYFEFIFGGIGREEFSYFPAFLFHTWQKKMAVRFEEPYPWTLFESLSTAKSLVSEKAIFLVCCGDFSQALQELQEGLKSVSKR